MLVYSKLCKHHHIADLDLNRMDHFVRQVMVLLVLALVPLLATKHRH
jgi:hypothetical protein